MKYFLDQDQSCHWYIVEASKRKEWDLWVDLNQDSGVPDYALEVDGDPSTIEFEL